ncbi:hypothetical protein [Ideonella sp. BN130291]|uniref:hypothetical protein n=1 Tax=Ideonella sp. BN130291 TaxID=3112940 RepID=UPI002E2729E0|nr:hypothetical protein [Ideonella sp. BN130291]
MKLGPVEQTVSAILQRLRPPADGMATPPAAATPLDIDLGQLAAAPPPADNDTTAGRLPFDSPAWRTQPGVHFVVSRR